MAKYISLVIDTYDDVNRIFHHLSDGGVDGFNGVKVESKFVIVHL